MELGLNSGSIPSKTESKIMVKVKILRGVVAGGAVCKAGEVVEVSDRDARDIIGSGAAEEVKGDPDPVKESPAPAKKKAAKKKVAAKQDQSKENQSNG